MLRAVWCQEDCNCRANKKVPHLNSQIVGTDRKGHLSAGCSMLLGSLNINSCINVYANSHKVYLCILYLHLCILIFFYHSSP